MRLAAFNQKFDLVSESHQFSYEILILRGDIAQNACPYIYALGSSWKVLMGPDILVSYLEKIVCYKWLLDSSNIYIDN